MSEPPPSSEPVTPRPLRPLPGGLAAAATLSEDAEQLEELQRVVFPTLADELRFKAAHYRRHLELFPEGQFVVLDGHRVVAATSTIRRHFDFDHPNHTFASVIQGGWLTSHEPDGDWLYGADLGVHPDYRRRGLAQALYAARQELVWRLGLRGQLTAGMISGYGDRQHTLSAEDYLAGVQAGRFHDPTLSMQLRVGFEVCCLLAEHLPDPVSANYSVLLRLSEDRAVAGAVRD